MEKQARTHEDFYSGLGHRSVKPYAHFSRSTLGTESVTKLEKGCVYVNVKGD
jgi:hypothetical protein